MRTIILKVTLIACLSFFFANNSSLAADSPTERTNATEANPNKIEVAKSQVKSSKKVKKLTLREKFRIIKQLRKERRKARKMGIKSDDQMILLYILAVILPPVAVGIYTDWEAKPTLINLLLTLIFWLPGIVHAFYILLS